MVWPARNTSMTKRKTREPGMEMNTSTRAVREWMSAQKGGREEEKRMEESGGKKVGGQDERDGGQ